MMDEGEANQLDERACEAEESARDVLKSLVQAAKDHAATMRRLAAVEAERDAALARLARVEGALVWWSRRPVRAEDLVRKVRAALSDPEGGT